MRIKSPPEEVVEPNITPMIDMVFLLLIFFLLATKFADVERDVRVKPPSSRHARPVSAIPEEIVVNVSREGELLIAGHPKTITQIDHLLGGAVSGNPHQAVVIEFDNNGQGTL